MTEQRAVTACRGGREPDSCNRANEETWWNPFSGATQGISISDHPPSGFAEKQPFVR